MNKKFGFQYFIDMIFSTTTTRVSWKALYRSKFIIINCYYFLFLILHGWDQMLELNLSLAYICI